MRDDDPNVEIDFLGQRLWVRRSTLTSGDGPLMPAPNHDEQLLEDSWGHVCGGKVWRYGEVIGRFEDLREVGGNGQSQRTGATR